MALLHFVNSTLMFVLVFSLGFNTSKIKDTLSNSNFSRYTKQKILLLLDGVSVLAYSLTLFCLLEERSLYNKWIFFLIMLGNIALGYLIYKLILSWSKNYIIALYIRQKILLISTMHSLLSELIPLMI